MAKERLIKHVPCWLTLLACLHISEALTESDGSAVTHKETKVVAPGHDVNLCEVPGSFISVECTRPSDSKDDRVFAFRDDSFLPEDQGPSFKERVFLESSDGKDCFILKNVSTDDKGDYECRVQKKDEMKLISTFSLVVTALPGDKDNRVEDGVMKNESGPSAPVVTPTPAAVNEGDANESCEDGGKKNESGLCTPVVTQTPAAVDEGLSAAAVAAIVVSLLFFVAGTVFVLKKYGMLSCITSSQNSPPRPPEEQTAMVEQNPDGPEAVSAV